MEILNAKIESADLFIEDHGILTMRLILNLSNGCGCAFGGYSLSYSRKNINISPLAYWVENILVICDANNIKELNGKIIRAKIENDLIVAIGHPIKDTWFEPRNITINE